MISGTPFRCHVDAVDRGFITAYGMGLVQGASGQECPFTIVGGGCKLLPFLPLNP